MVEVKSGNDCKKHSALNKIRRVEAWNIQRSYVFCKGNTELENGVIYLPWYQIMFLKPDEAPKDLIYEVDLSQLP